MTWLKGAVFSFIFLLGSCSSGVEPSLFIPDIDLGTPGIIGDVQFFTEPKYSIEALYDSTSVLAVYDDISGEAINLGTALLVNNTQDNERFLVTAAHNIIDFSTNELRGSRVSLGYANDNYSYDVFDLKELKINTMLYSHANDFIMIKIDDVKDRPALAIDFSRPFPKEATKNGHEKDRFVSVSVTWKTTVSFF